MKYLWTAFFVIFVVMFFSDMQAYAARKSVTTSGSAIIFGATTFDQAKTLAINRARAAGIEAAAGISVNSTTMMVGGLVSYDVIKTLSKGFIVSEKILKWQTEWVTERESDQLPFPKITVNLDTIIEIPERSFIRSHVFDAQLNQTTFRNGEHVIFTIEPREDIYLLIVNYTSKGSIIPVFPNSHTTDNAIPGGRAFYYPKPDSKEVHIEINTFQYHDNDTEAFLLFALPVEADTKSIQWSKVFPAGEEMGYADFHEKLLELPLRWLGEKILIYTVNKI